ncbi:hypothetical protein [Erythrobacter crassostreae]|uniref:HPr kinase/phosphorylase C-terminal domain-containing protein n=1 Tax=Erythrobacter crassostreae TaxID=2828328 RepID=A0A9X1F3S3_9SPHN|nr:hypothetical protein [Erythrobacter crassostrea]MBV7258290.1 hypothetical protein [Erythrobacter crassostrea]
MTHLTMGQPRKQAQLATSPYDRWISPNGDCVCEFHRTSGGFKLRFPDEADFEIDGETGAVAAVPVSEGSENLVQKLFDNSIVPLLGNHNGGVFLHGSGVRTPSGAIAFLGHSRSGKTTLAGAFAKSGYPFMAEDVVELDQRANGYRLLPNSAGLRLFKDSAEYLLGSDVGFSDVDGKQRIDAADHLPFADQPHNLCAMFMLGADHEAALALEPLSSSAALQGLMQHGFILDVEDRQRLESHFNRIGELVEAIPTFSLDYPRDYSTLPNVISAIFNVSQGLAPHETN